MNTTLVEQQQQHPTSPVARRPFFWRLGSASSSSSAPPTPETPKTPKTPDTPGTPPNDKAKRRRRIQPPVHQPRLSKPSNALPRGTDVTPVQKALPALHQTSDWQQVYSTMHDGISLQTLYAKCEGTDPIVLCIRDTDGNAFGVFTATPWQPHPHYYGTGETFVFTLYPKAAVYKWARGNSYFQLASPDSLAVGGGGKFAIFIDSMLERGSSGSCATFASPCLASNDQFDIVVLEAYKLVSSHKFKLDDHHD